MWRVFEVEFAEPRASPLIVVIELKAQLAGGPVILRPSILGEPARQAVAREHRDRVWFERYGAHMIATLRGILKLRDPGRLIVETAGIGYEIFVPLNTYYRMPSVGAEVELEIRQIVREDALLLYGFATIAEKRAFDLLMGVQHVGAKLALAVLSVLSPKDLVAAITHEDVERIDAVPGVGAKVAERVVRELRDKIGGLHLTAPEQAMAISSNGHTGGSSLVDDAISALINLGYKPAEAKRAVDGVDNLQETDGLETLIRKSLAIILGEK